MESNKEQHTEHVVICQRVDNQQYYAYRGDGIFENLSTGVRGEIPKEIAKKNLRGKLMLTKLCSKNPVLIDMLRVASKNNFMTIEIEEYGK